MAIPFTLLHPPPGRPKGPTWRTASAPERRSTHTRAPHADHPDTTDSAPPGGLTTSLRSTPPRPSNMHQPARTTRTPDRATATHDPRNAQTTRPSQASKPNTENRSAPNTSSCHRERPPSAACTTPLHITCQSTPRRPSPRMPRPTDLSDSAPAPHEQAAGTRRAAKQPYAHARTSLAKQGEVGRSSPKGGVAQHFAYGA